METLQDWLIKIKETDKIVIVEGKKDVQALTKIGIPKSKIIHLSGPIFSVAEKVANETKDAIILTDQDIEGKKLYSRLKHELIHQGVRIDRKYREFLFKKTELSHIEGIDTYFKKYVL